MTHTELIEAIATAAKAKNLSWYRLAKTTGLTEAQVSRIFRGMHSPRLDTLLKLYEAVEVELQVKSNGLES